MSDQTLYIMYYLLFFPPIIIACWFFLKLLVECRKSLTKEEIANPPKINWRLMDAIFVDPIVYTGVCVAAVVVGWAAGNAIIKNGKK